MMGTRNAYRAVLLAGVIGMWLMPALASAQAAADEGIPVQSELVRSKCGGCHRPDANNRMSRISYRRATPENWQRTVERMISLNRAPVNETDARAIVKYLSDHQGLAPEEARQVTFEAERRIIEYTYPGDAETGTLCGGCHSMGRVMSERRNAEEWGLLVSMHRGYYPLVDNQPIDAGLAGVIENCRHHP